IQINEPNPLNPSLTSEDATCNNECDGSAEVTSVTGGTAPYTYQWYNGFDEGSAISGETSSNISGLCAGNYSVTITDETAVILHSTSRSVNHLKS
ncbi:MAG: SprB repeat-containing protein, partial [Flavobacteriales bacterium]